MEEDFKLNIEGSSFKKTMLLNRKERMKECDGFLCQVVNGAILQQVFVVDYVVQPQMCGDCHRVEAKDFWKAVVQVRQKVMRER